jgi:hypothetical protein
VTAFLTSIVVSLLMAGAIVWEGKRRPPGTKVTWGEAMFAAMFIFFLMLMVYGVVPDRWLRFADSELKWRTDKIGIPMGPMGHFLHNVLHIGSATNVIAPNGVKFFGRGKIKISANTIENIIATLIYGVALAGHIALVRWWQNRGKKPAPSTLEKTSAYGRPLVRSS